MQEVEVGDVPKLYWLELFFYNDLYLSIYTLALKVHIIFGHNRPDLIILQNFFLLELQLEVVKQTIQIS
jgi:hypothetical protein